MIGQQSTVPDQLTRRGEEPAKRNRIIQIRCFITDLAIHLGQS